MYETDQDLSQPRTLSQYLRLYFSGFAMGSADIVPGVSGGTMAFILGIYETLIDAIKSFNIDVIRHVLKLDIRRVLELVPLRFLIALGAGILTAGLLLANVLHTLLEEQPTFLFAFFAGLILASILAIGLKVKWTPNAIAALVIAAVVAFFISGFDDNTAIDDLVDAVHTDGDVAAAQAALISELEANDFTDAEEQVNILVDGLEAGTDTDALVESMQESLYTESSPITLFFSGMLAICAMILPGISGSFILLIIGQYAAVLGAVRGLDFVRIGFFGAGCAIGIILFSRILSWLLKHYENVTIAALVGFMFGSLRKIWLEAANGVEIISQTGKLASDQWALVILLALVGFILVSVLDHLQTRSNPLLAWVWR